MTFLPHGACLLWQPSLMLLHLVSDAIIALAYYVIPVIFLYALRRQKYMASQFQKLFLLSFGLFIFLCGTTHIIGILVLWKPIYWIDGIVKAVTGIVSVTTAFLVAPQIPKEISIRQNIEQLVNLKIDKCQYNFDELDNIIFNLKKLTNFSDDVKNG